MKVGIIDYGVGNLGSVAHALEELNVLPVLVTEPRELYKNDRIILPGVGNFTDCMRILRTEAWISPIRQAVEIDQIPLLGICLGMQLLADFGSEGADETNTETEGLGLIPGRVTSLVSQGCSLRIPHVGWNNIQTCESGRAMFEGIPSGTDFYFVHSYAFVPKETSSIFAQCEYDVSFVAAIGNNKVWGTQFHPEKSSRAGMQLLRNFILGM